MSALPSARSSAPLRLFLVAGEHSGDALGAKLMAALKARLGERVMFSGVGGAEMEAQGLTSLFAIEDVAVMGPLNILAALPRLTRRVYQTVNAALAYQPDAVVIIDSPEFTHPIAKRIRKRAAGIPIINYVSPSVWAWRPGRARRMRWYVDEILGLLPFEPEAHERLGGPHCTYVGHPLIERLGDITGADAMALRTRLGFPDEAPVLLVLPGSRRSEVERLIDVFGGAIGELHKRFPSLEVVIPVVPHVRGLIEAKTAAWNVKPAIIDGTEDKYAAMRLARAALAASGTVTLELALAGTPSVIAYKVDPVAAPLLRRLITAKTIVLANLVAGEHVYPELIQEECTAENLASALGRLLDDTPARAAQLAALPRIPARLHLDAGTPSEAAAEAVLAVFKKSIR
ncbi:MAG: lipid-A-disaccharide synthase [Hyphomicrobium sp.]